MLVSWCSYGLLYACLRSGTFDDLLGDPIAGFADAAEQQSGELRAAPVEVGVVLPGRADPAVNRDARAGRVVGCLLGGEPRGARRERQLIGLGLGGVTGVEAQAPRRAGVPQDLDDLLLDSLIGADRAA